MTEVSMPDDRQPGAVSRAWLRSLPLVGAGVFFVAALLGVFGPDTLDGRWRTEVCYSPGAGPMVGPRVERRLPELAILQTPSGRNVRVPRVGDVPDLLRAHPEWTLLSYCSAVD